jgi:hypothetical protein
MSTLIATALIGWSLLSYYLDHRWKSKLSQRLDRIEEELRTLKKAA